MYALFTMMQAIVAPTTVVTPVRRTDHREPPLLEDEVRSRVNCRKQSEVSSTRATRPSAKHGRRRYEHEEARRRAQQAAVATVFFIIGEDNDRSGLDQGQFNEPLRLEGRKGT
jgi:hypothetical protein